MFGWLKRKPRRWHRYLRVKEIVYGSRKVRYEVQQKVRNPYDGSRNWHKKYSYDFKEDAFKKADEMQQTHYNKSVTSEKYFR